MLSIFVRQLNSENYSGDELSLFIYISTMDDPNTKGADEIANAADEKAGEAHKSAAEAHEEKAA